MSTKRRRSGLVGGWPRLSPHTKTGALPFSRSLREGGAFDLPRTGWTRCRNPRPVPAKERRDEDGAPANN